MKQFATTLHTSGDGLWSNVARAVRVTRMVVEIIVQGEGEADTYGDVEIYFNTEDWNTERDSLIYTDPGFLEGLKAHLASLGFSRAAVDDALEYSEAGMQDDEFVSMDSWSTGGLFAREVMRLAPEIEGLEWWDGGLEVTMPEAADQPCAHRDT
jgi:hypothetical protein